MSGIYNIAKVKGLDALVSANLKVMLVTSGYSFNPDHQYVSTPVANEVSGTGYTGGFGGSGRKPLTGKADAVDNTNDRGYLTANNITWSAINVGAVAGAIIFCEVSADADSWLVAFIDGGFPQTTNGTDLIVTWSLSPVGIIQVS